MIKQTKPKDIAARVRLILNKATGAKWSVEPKPTHGGFVLAASCGAFHRQIVSCADIDAQVNRIAGNFISGCGNA